MSEKSERVETLKCPQCGTPLKPVGYHGGAMALNRDQWESVRAGDWYCDKCKSNVAKTGFKYWWNHELQVSSPATVQPEPQPKCIRCGKPVELVMAVCPQCARDLNLLEEPAKQPASEILGEPIQPEQIYRNDGAAKQPANTHPKPGADGYCPHGYAVAANCDKCFAERKRQRDEAEKQPANTAGETDRQERCVRCGNMVSGWVDTDWSNGRICLVCESIFAPESVKIRIEQPACPRCAELEERLLEALNTHEDYLAVIEALRKERDDLKAKCEAIENALREIHDFPVHSEPIGCADKMQEIASAALAGVVKAAEPEHTPHKEEQK